jgi:hypothetical protein
MILKPKAHIVWRRSRGPRLGRAALAADAARRRREAPSPTVEPDLASPIATGSGP